MNTLEWFKYTWVLLAEIGLTCWFLEFGIYLNIRYIEEILEGVPILGQNYMTTIHDVDILCSGEIKLPRCTIKT